MPDYDVNATRIFFYCFESGPDIDDPSAPGKKRKDSGGQRVIQAEWRSDGRVYCPRCRRLLLFDGERLCDNLSGKLHFWTSSNGDEVVEPHGHFFRYDLKGIGYVSPRYTPPIPGGKTEFNWEKELEFLIKEGVSVEMQQVP
jgi:hypothetical protein